MRLRNAPPAKALVVGWFSLPFGGATAGDLASLEVVRRWLGEAGWDHDVAFGEPLDGGVDWRGAAPDAYSHVIHVCGPVGRELEVAQILARFADCTLLAVNVSVVGHDGAFARVIARDGRPDLAFLADGPRVPVVGLTFVQPQAEYSGGRHAE